MRVSKPASLLPNGILLLSVSSFWLQVLYLAYHLLVGYHSAEVLATINADGVVFRGCVTADVDQMRLKRRRINRIHGSSSVCRLLMLLQCSPRKARSQSQPHGLAGRREVSRLPSEALDWSLQ